MYKILLALALSIGVLSANATEHTTKRIISLDASVTETIYALGAQKQLVGRDITSVYPKQANKIPSVGYMRNLKTEGILSLQPTIVLANNRAKPDTVLKQLEKAGVQVKIITARNSVAGVIAKINTVAKLTGKQKQSKKLIAKLNKQVAKANQYINNAAKTKTISALFIMHVQGNQLLVAGNRSEANSMLNLAKISNPAQSKFNYYKPVSKETLLQMNPTWLVMMPHTARSIGGADKILNMPSLQQTTAGKNKNLYITSDGFLSFGPRLGKHLLRFAKTLYEK